MSSENIKSNQIEMNLLKEELCSRDEPEGEFISDSRPTQTSSIYHLVPDMEIKHEEVDFHRDSTGDFLDLSHVDLDKMPGIPLYVDCNSAKLNEFYSDLSHCEENCETCQKYRMILMKHVRSTHDPPQPTHDPLHIDDPASTDHDLPEGDLIQIEGEVEENIGQMDYSKEVDFHYNQTSNAEDDFKRIYDTKIDIKHEDPGYLDNTNTSKPTSDSEADRDGDFEIVLNIPHIDCSSIKTEEEDLDDCYVDLRQCVRGCQTCEKYVRLLSEHVRAAHAPPQPSPSASAHLTQNPLRQRVVEPKDPPRDKRNSNGNKSLNGKTCCSRINIKEKQFRNPQSLSESCHNMDRQSDQKMTVLSTLVRQKSVQRLYVCDVCEKWFIKSSHLTDHKRTHTGERPYGCDECEKSYSSKAALTKHNKRYHTGVKPYKCTVCEKSFTILSVFNVHAKVHTGERPFKCDECGKSYMRLVHLTTHKEKHTEEKAYECSVCGKRFITMSMLNVHTKFHTGERPYNCDECDKCYMKASDLTRHKRTHGERSYWCEECGMRFAQKATLTTHKRQHTGEKLHKCTVCKKSFTTLNILNVHNKVHTRERRFNCDECEKKFTTLDHLTAHRRSHDEEKPFQCTVCRKTFRTVSELNVHAKCHRWRETIRV